jgi:PST family polysaccharide transporter
MRNILKTTGLMAGSSLIGVAMQVIRTKLIAVELGPTGIGSLGILAGFLAFASVLVGLGLGSSGVRELGESVGKEDDYRSQVLRRSLRAASYGLAIAGGLLIYAFRGPIASDLLGDATLRKYLGWIALAVAISVASGAESALLNGYRRIRQLAIMGACGAAGGTLATVAAAIAGVDLIPVALVAPPLSTYVVALWFTRRLGAPRFAVPVTEASVAMRALVALGVVFMLSAVLGVGVQLVARLILDDTLGRAEVGQFQAAFNISGTYIGFLLTALATDYFPRISSMHADTGRLNAAANEQLEVSLLIVGPMVLAMITAAPLVISLLYSSAFADSAELLRYQLVAEVLRVTAWTLGFVLLARNRRRYFIAGELLWSAVYLGAIVVGVPALGLEFAGVAFGLAYAAVLVLYVAVLRSDVTLELTPAANRMLGGFLAAAATLAVVVPLGALGVAAGVVASAVAAALAFRYVARSAGGWRGLRSGAS